MRTAEVLDRSFLEGLEGLPTEEVRRRRDESLAEREFQSYLRRQVQARQDILASERARREAGRESPPLVERLTSALSTGPRSERARGEALRTTLTDSDIEEAEQQLSGLLPGGPQDDPSALDDEELEQSLEELTGAERAVSARRAEVIRVHDRLQEELKRRYREDPSEIPSEV